MKILPGVSQSHMGDELIEIVQYMLIMETQVSKLTAGPAPSQYLSMG
jgi:hypothetical protein